MSITLHTPHTTRPSRAAMLAPVRPANPYAARRSVLAYHTMRRAGIPARTAWQRATGSEAAWQRLERALARHTLG